jgi:hypothetical protein
VRLSSLEDWTHLNTELTFARVNGRTSISRRWVE